MRQMTPAQMKGIQAEIRYILEESVSDDYARYILDAEDHAGITFMESVIQDVLESSDWDEHGHYNDSDIRFAIGRQLIKRLEIKY